MKLTCDKQQLLDSLTLVGRAVPSKTTKPILECILLQAVEGLSLTATDLDITINVENVPAEVEEEGSVALNAKLLTEVVRKMPGDFITLEVNNDVAFIKSGRSKLKIIGQPAVQFPVTPAEEMDYNGAKYNIKAPILRDMVKKTIFSVSTDPSNIPLTGEFLQISGDSLRVVAVDMFRISFRSEVLNGEEIAESKAIVPAKALNELSRIVSTESDSEVNFYFTEKRAVFETNEFTLSSSIIEGNYIRFEQIFSEDFATRAVCKRAELLSMFERAILVAPDSRMLPIKIIIGNDEINVSTSSERGEVDDVIECDVDGKELTIYFNPRYYIEALRALEDEEVELKFNTQLSPCNIKGVNAEIDARYLIVPLRPPASV